KDGIGVPFDRRNIRPEVLGTDRRPDFLNDLAAAVLERLLKAALLFVTEGIVSCYRDHLLVSLLAGPFTDCVRRLRRAPTSADEIREVTELTLGQVVCRRDRGDIQNLFAGTHWRQSVASRGQQATDQHLHVVL